MTRFLRESHRHSQRKSTSSTKGYDYCRQKFLLKSSWRKLLRISSQNFKSLNFKFISSFILSLIDRSQLFICIIYMLTHMCVCVCGEKGWQPVMYVLPLVFSTLRMGSSSNSGSPNCKNFYSVINLPHSKCYLIPWVVFHV